MKMHFRERCSVRIHSARGPSRHQRLALKRPRGCFSSSRQCDSDEHSHPNTRDTRPWHHDRFKDETRLTARDRPGRNRSQASYELYIPLLRIRSVAIPSRPRPPSSCNQLNRSSDMKDHPSKPLLSLIHARSVPRPLTLLNIPSSLPYRTSSRALLDVLQFSSISYLNLLLTLVHSHIQSTSRPWHSYKPI